MNKIMITGGRPTGRLHLGHYVGAFKTFVNMQNDYTNYFIISDMHMLTTKNKKEDIDSIFNKAVNFVIDAIGMGVDPEKTTFYLQSQIPSLSNIYGIFQNYININRINKVSSLKEMSKHSCKEEMSLGLIGYPVLEAADVFSIGADVVPVGKDNIDHIKITQEIITTLNNEFSMHYKIPEYITTENNYLIGLDGSNKMSKSLDNAIYVRDSIDEVHEKIRKIPWNENNNINVVREYLKVFYDSDFELIKNKDYDSTLTEKDAKDLLINCIEKKLIPMRKRMEPYLNNRNLVLDILKNGTKQVKCIADNAANELRKGIGLVDFGL